MSSRDGEWTGVEVEPAGTGPSLRPIQPFGALRPRSAVLGIALALASSVAWGVSDFLGGLQARRISALTVLLVSQPVGLVLALAVALAFGGDPLSTRDAVLAAGAGAVVVLALAAFYRAMALGSVTIVATIGALGVLGPVVAGVIQGDRPAPIQVAGAAAGIAGVILVTRSPDPEWRSARRASIGLAALAALGFGAFSLHSTSPRGPNPPGRSWRHGSAGWRCSRSSPRASGRRCGSRLRSCRSCWRSASSTSSRTRSSRSPTNHGLLSLVAVAGSLYSAVTVLLARFVLGERLGPAQRGGLVAALVGVALIAAGA